MKIQENKRNGQRFINLPKSVCTDHGWIAGDELEFDSATIPGHTVVRKVRNAGR